MTPGLSGWLLLAALTQAPEAPAADVAAAKKGRLAAMTAVVDAVVLQTTTGTPKTLVRTEHPIVRYTNPVTSQFAEGTTFLWLDGKRPLAAVSPSLRDTGVVYWELSALSDEPLQLTRDGKPVWTPKSANRPSAKLPDGPEPAATAAARLTQLRAQARRFRLREQRRETWQDGRLLTQPLYQWEAPEQGVLQGALFGFAETTDPELLLLFEARQVPGTPHAEWWFAVAKMTSSPCELSLDDQLLWTGSGYWKNPRGPEDSYVEATVGKIDPELLKIR